MFPLFRKWALGLRGFAVGDVGVPWALTRLPGGVASGGEASWVAYSGRDYHAAVLRIIHGNVPGRIRNITNHIRQPMHRRSDTNAGFALVRPRDLSFRVVRRMPILAPYASRCITIAVWL